MKECETTLNHKVSIMSLAVKVGEFMAFSRAEEIIDIYERMIKVIEKKDD